MSRSGYSEDCDDNWAWIKWRGAVASAIRGKRGQAFLREALMALDQLPEKALTPNDLSADGAFCTLGAVGRARGADVSSVDPYDQESVAHLLSIPHALACEIMFENDESSPCETPRARWERMRAWVVQQLKGDMPAAASSSEVPTISPSEASATALSTDEPPSSPTPPKTGEGQ